MFKNLRSSSFYLNFPFTCLALVLFISMSACSGKKKSADKEEVPPPPDNGVSVTVFQATPILQVPRDDDSNFLTNLHTFAISGLCGAAITQVVVEINNVAQAPINCTSQAWSYSGAFANPEGVYPFKVHGLDANAAAQLATQISANFKKDVTPPTISGFTAPLEDPQLLYYTPNVRISGTLTGDTFKIESSDGTGTLGFTVGASSFTFDTRMTDGESRNISFTAYDKVGNASTIATRTISYLGPIDSMTNPKSQYKANTLGLPDTGPITDSGYKLEAVSFSEFGNRFEYTGGSATLGVGLINQAVR